MNPNEDFETMEILLFEYSICHFYNTKKIFPSDNILLHDKWIKLRTISCREFDKLAVQYSNLGKLIKREIKHFDPISTTLENPFIVEKLIEMIKSPTRILSWPEGYLDLNVSVSAEDLEKRIRKLTNLKSGKLLL